MQTEETVTLEQARHRFGVGADALRRLIRIGALPEARRNRATQGREWVISTEALPVIAQRQGWTLDLRGDAPVILGPDDAPSPGAGNGQPTEPGPGPGDETQAGAEPTDDAGAGPTDADADEPAESALVPRADGAPRPAGDSGDGAPSMDEVMDMHLLDRLLGAQEERIHAVAEASQSRQALESMGSDLDRVRAELDVERREHLIASDRARQERQARASADAKVAELRDRVVREMALAESEREARADAVARSIRAERDAATAVAALGWRARRRYKRRTANLD